MNYNEAIGCIHVHSIYSDGSGTVPEIIAAGQACGLDYLLLSDHMTLAARRAGYQGWHGKLFMSIGYEINDQEDQHHYLAFGLDEELPPHYSHLEYLQAVKEKSGLGIAAHPFEKRVQNQSLPGFPAIPWGRLDYPEIEVIEIWNMMSHWLEKTTVRNKYWNIVHPRSFSTEPAAELLAWWDEINQHHKVTGVGSVDVHATKVKVCGLYSKAIFDYKIMFKSIRTHLLLPRRLSEVRDPDEAERMLLTAIRSGNAFVANFRRGDASGFRCRIETDNESIIIGETARGSSGWLRVDLPASAQCQVIKNGQVIFSQMVTKHFDLKITPGVYRLETRRQERGWIFTNHLRLKGESN